MCLEDKHVFDQEEEDLTPITRVSAPSDICPQSNEWFAHFPYPCPPHLVDEMYGIISTHGGHHNGHKEPYCQLYANQLAMIITRLFTSHNNEHITRRRRERPVVGLLNFCLSGGGLHFMKRDGFKRVYQPQHWPVFLMSSTQDNKDALVGGLWDSYFECLSHYLLQHQSTNKRKVTLTSTTCSLHQVFLKAKTQYRRNNIYELYGHICHLAYPSKLCSFRSHLQPLLTSGEFGCPDFAKISELQDQYRRRGVYIYNTYNWGVEIDLVFVVKECLLYIALPDYVYGELSGIGETSIQDIFLNCS